MPNSKLLAGLRVIDLSQYIPGPFATRQLADLGADVIKVEPPCGDPMRRFMAANDDRPSAVYRHVNRGKRVCTLDLKQDRDRDIFSALLQDADILLESYRPGVLARLGFGLERLDEINPRLIHCALSGYGQAGPWAQRAGHDINYCAVAGQSLVSGTAERPVIGYPPLADHAGGMQAAVAMLAALYDRDNRDGGVFLDISITESILGWQYLPLLGGESERAASMLNGGAACYNFYRCADGAFISLGAIEANFWANFCNTLQRPEWIARQFEPMPQSALIAEVGAVIETQGIDDWNALLDPVDCCYAPLLAPEQLAGHPLVQALGACPDSGPAYPGHIDGDRIGTADDCFELEAGVAPVWQRES